MCTYSLFSSLWYLIHSWVVFNSFHVQHFWCSLKHSHFSWHHQCYECCIQNMLGIREKSPGIHHLECLPMTHNISSRERIFYSFRITMFSVFLKFIRFRRHDDSGRMKGRKLKKFRIIALFPEFIRCVVKCLRMWREWTRNDNGKNWQKIDIFPLLSPHFHPEEEKIWTFFCFSNEKHLITLRMCLVFTSFESMMSRYIDKNVIFLVRASSHKSQSQGRRLRARIDFRLYLAPPIMFVINMWTNFSVRSTQVKCEKWNEKNFRPFFIFPCRTHNTEPWTVAKAIEFDIFFYVKSVQWLQHWRTTTHVTLARLEGSLDDTQNIHHLFLHSPFRWRRLRSSVAVSSAEKGSHLLGSCLNYSSKFMNFFCCCLNVFLFHCWLAFHHRRVWTE